MSVHEAISKHSQKQHHALQLFLQLDRQRELFIEEELENYKNNVDFNVDKINEVTKQINELGKKEIVPSRQLVTKQMIIDFAKKNEK